MPLGYAIAVLCEAAGLLGLLTVVFIDRAERRAKASGLRVALRSGRSAFAKPGSTGGHRRGSIPVRTVRLPTAAPQPRDPGDLDSGGLDSAARSALQRAIPRHT